MTVVKEIAVDAFWDGSDGIRSSSDEDPTQYYDPSSAQREANGRSIASLLPSRGPRGVIIPRSSRLGGSLGFNPHKPVIVNIDPDIKGQSSVVDLAQITNEDIDNAIQETSNVTDYKLAASLVFRKLAIGTEPVGMPSDNFNSQVVKEEHPLGLAGAYVTPRQDMERTMKAYSPQKQQETKPQQPKIKYIQPAKAFEKGKEARLITDTSGAKYIQKDNPEPLTDEEVENMGVELFKQEALARRHVKELEEDLRPERSVSQNRSNLFNKKKQEVNQPSETVTYELENYGQLTCPYYKVIRDGITLALIWDKNSSGQKFTPSVSDNPIIVDPHNHDSIYKVAVPGIQFELDNYEIYILLIVDEAKK